MPATDVVVVEATLKEGWTQDDLERQFQADDPLLTEIEKRSPMDKLGEYALTPVHTGRAGGISQVPSTGSKSLNAADGQKTAQAMWKWGRIWDAIEIDTAAIKQTASKDKAVAQVLDTEVEGSLSDTRKQITRQLFADQTGLICQTAANESTKTLKLATTGTYGLGVEATRQGWLVEGQVVDIGTTEAEGTIAADVTITAVNDSETEPSITVSGEAVTTTTSHYVSIANARSGKTSYDFNGFRNIISTSTKLGNLDPSTEPGWKAAFVSDAEGDPITRDMVITGRRKVRQKGSGSPNWAFTSLEQVQFLENETYPQVRFDGTKSQNTGDGESIMIGNLKVQGHEDCPTGDFNYARKEHLFCLRESKPYWVSQEYGGKILHFQPGSTFLYGALEYFFQLCVNRRNAFGAIRGLAKEAV